jgi:RNA polymerase sigma factor (sigma-70 family)
VSGKTLSLVHDARDAEDKRLLEAGEHKLLLAGYFHPVRERCFLTLRSRDAADEVAQAVFVRLLSELRRGKRYPVPFRAIVWMVVKWTIRGFYPAAKLDGFLPEDWDCEAPDAYAEWEDDHDLGLVFADLPPRQREVLELRWRRGLDPGQIAEELGIERNAVDQALYNGHRKLAGKLRA